MWYWCNNHITLTAQYSVPDGVLQQLCLEKQTHNYVTLVTRIPLINSEHHLTTIFFFTQVIAKMNVFPHCITFALGGLDCVLTLLLLMKSSTEKLKLILTLQDE